MNLSCTQHAAAEASKRGWLKNNEFELLEIVGSLVVFQAATWHRCIYVYIYIYVNICRYIHIRV